MNTLEKAIAFHKENFEEISNDLLSLDVYRDKLIADRYDMELGYRGEKFSQEDIDKINSLIAECDKEIDKKKA